MIYFMMVESSERYASRWIYLALVIIIHSILIIIVQLQVRYGSRFFLPHRFRKYKHDYLRRLEDEYLPVDMMSENVPICELCLGHLNTHGMLDLELNSKEYKRLKERIGHYSET